LIQCIHRKIEWNSRDWVSQLRCIGKGSGSGPAAAGCCVTLIRATASRRMDTIWIPSGSAMAS
ncbi:MAG: hypothetical protein KDA55_01250, partial [Planctomycetales bacterium]|nr:hypothetical protein [Planctomycetales bacterium]